MSKSLAYAAASALLRAYSGYAAPRSYRSAGCARVLASLRASGPWHAARSPLRVCYRIPLHLLPRSCEACVAREGWVHSGGQHSRAPRDCSVNPRARALRVLHGTVLVRTCMAANECAQSPSAPERAWLRTMWYVRNMHLCALSAIDIGMYVYTHIQRSKRTFRYLSPDPKFGPFSDPKIGAIFLIIKTRFPQ